MSDLTFVAAAVKEFSSGATVELSFVKIFGSKILCQAKISLRSLGR